MPYTDYVCDSHQSSASLNTVCTEDCCINLYFVLDMTLHTHLQLDYLLTSKCLRQLYCQFGTSLTLPSPRMYYSNEINECKVLHRILAVNLTTIDYAESMTPDS